MAGKKAVIFDLDGILIDSRASEAARLQRRWGDVYKMIPRLPPYPGADDMMKWLAKREIAIGIVTSRPGRYGELITRRWKWEVRVGVCFGDVPQHKPNPEPMTACLAKLGVAAADAVAVCLDSSDVKAAKGAGIFAVAAKWGLPPKAPPLDPAPDSSFNAIPEFRDFLAKRFQVLPV